MNGEGWLLPIIGLLVAFQPLRVVSAPLPIGVFTGKSSSRVNGMLVPSGAVLYSGDRISTNSTGAASIHLRENDVLALGTSTDVRITANGNGFLALLDRGKIAAMGGPAGRVIVRADRITVEPEHASGWYEVVWNGDELKVYSRRGTTLVKGAGRTVEVAAGSLMKVKLARGRSFRRSGKILMVTMSTAAAAAAAGLAIANAAPGTTCVSPSQLTCP